MALTLTADERTELQRRVRSLKIRAEDARRARVILMLADDESYSTIEAMIPCYRDYINRWRRRFVAQRLDGLRPRCCGSTPTVLTSQHTLGCMGGQAMSLHVIGMRAERGVGVIHQPRVIAAESALGPNNVKRAPRPDVVLVAHQVDTLPAVLLIRTDHRLCNKRWRFEQRLNSQLPLSLLSKDLLLGDSRRGGPHLVKCRAGRTWIGVDWIAC
jgi:hypothetical protein